MPNQDDEMNEFADIVSKASPNTAKRVSSQSEVEYSSEVEQGEERLDSSGLNSRHSKMWATVGRDCFPAESAISQLNPGQYTVKFCHSRGIYFSQRDINLDNLLILPDSNSEHVLKHIDDFWANEDRFRKYGFLWKRGIMLWGPPGSGKCLGKNTPVLMFDGSIKKVQDIKINDLLMGDDSTPRKVLSLCNGEEQLYEVQQKNGDPYIVNESHILSLKRIQIEQLRKGNSHRNRLRKTVIRDISVNEYLKSSDNFKYRFKGYKAKVEFPAQDITLDPYFLGLWLGDGGASKAAITTADETIKDYLFKFAKGLNLHVNVHTHKNMGKAANYDIRSHTKPIKKGINCILTTLQNLNILNNKHIPDVYLQNTKDIRLRLLAGLLDSDGYHFNNCFEFSNTNNRIIDGITYLARSLGFKVSTTKRTVSTNYKENCTYWRVHISGHTNLIPTKLKRNQSLQRKQIKCPLQTGITLKKLKIGEYYGFEIDGNKRFLLGDFTVTHNTSCVQQLSKQIVEAGGITVYCVDPNLTAKGLELMRIIEPDRPLIVIFEDLDAIVQQNGEADLLAMLDGELQVDNVVFVATTNYPNLLDKRFINRPSRFDEIIKIGMPSAQARRFFLEHKNPRLQDELSELTEWVELTDGFSIAHLKEVIISVECFNKPMHVAIKRLRSMIDATASSYESTASSFKGFTG